MCVQWISLVLLTVIFNERFLIMVGATDNPDQLKEAHEVVDDNSPVELRIAFIGQGTVQLQKRGRRNTSRKASFLKTGSLVYLPESGTQKRQDKKIIQIGIPKANSVELKWDSGNTHKGQDLKIKTSSKLIDTDSMDFTGITYFNGSLITISRKNDTIYSLDRNMDLNVLKNLRFDRHNDLVQLSWLTVQEIEGKQSLYVGMNNAFGDPLRVRKVSQNLKDEETIAYNQLNNSLKNGLWMEGRKVENNKYYSIASCNWNNKNKTFYIMANYIDKSVIDRAVNNKGMFFCAGPNLDEPKVELVTEKLTNGFFSKCVKFLPSHEDRIVVILEQHNISKIQNIILFDFVNDNVISTIELVLPLDTSYAAFEFLK